MLNIADFFKEVENENLSVQRKDGLILFDYTRTCQFNRGWNDTTLAARGIVFEEATGKLVARPMRKFFNLQELECQEGLKLIDPTAPFQATTKEDGSMGILYFWNGDWQVNTRGSFESDQAKWAKAWMDKNVNKDFLNPEFTYLVEIIYPSNRIVIDYKGKEGLILLTAICNEDGHEVFYTKLIDIGAMTNLEVVNVHEFNSIEEIAKVCEGLDSNHEGFVVKYPRTNFRFKIKGAEYCKIHSMIANLTPLSFWRAIDLETLEIPFGYVVLLPEEFRETSDKLKKVIERMHKAKWYDIAAKGESCPLEFESDKQRWFYLEEKFGDEAGYVLGYLKGNHNRVKKQIHMDVRPTGNTVPGVDFSKVQRVLNEG